MKITMINLYYYFGTGAWRPGNAQDHEQKIDLG
jgi:hypothetical protein